jgi:hypothetical protein
VQVRGEMIQVAVAGLRDPRDSVGHAFSFHQSV